MMFQTFLDCMEHMFNIYEKEGEPFTEQAKVCELFEKTKGAASLVPAVATLKVRKSIEAKPSFVTVANHMASEVFQSSDYQFSRRILQIVRGGGRGGGRSGGRGRPGSTHTGYWHPKEWKALPDADKDKIRDLRDQKNKPGGSATMHPKCT